MSDQQKAMDNVAKFFEQLEKRQRDQEKASARLTQAFDDLSQASTKTLIDRLKSIAKNLGIFDDAQLDLIKSSHDLTDAIAEQEKKLDQIKALQEKYRKSIKDAEEQQKKFYKSGKNLLKAAESQYDADLKSIGLTRDQAKALVQNIEALSTQTRVAEQSAKRWDHLNKEIEGVGKSLKNWAESTFTIRNGLERMGDGFKKGYDQFIKLTQVGLQSTLIAVNTQALNLRMSFEEFSEVIAKNRDTINLLGGGSKGIQELGSRIKEASEDLAYMGKDGIAATARFTSTLKSAGTTIDDEVGYKKQMKALQKQFKEFNALYGDSYDEYAKLIESQYQESGVQSRLVGLGKQHAAAIQKEILERTENYKKIGMSNEQIESFNKKLEDLYDPLQNNQQQKISEAINLQNLVGQIINQDPSSKLADPKMQAKLQEMTSMQMRGATAEQMKTWFSKNSDFSEAIAESISQAEQKAAKIVDAGGDASYINQMIAQFKKMSGSSGEALLSQGKAAAQARIENRNYQGEDERYNAAKSAAVKAADPSVKKPEEMDASDLLALSLRKARDVVEPLNIALESTLGLITTGGLIAALSTVAGPIGIGGMLESLKKLIPTIGETGEALGKTASVFSKFGNLLQKLIPGIVGEIGTAVAPLAAIYGVTKWAEDQSHDEQRVTGLKSVSDSSSKFLSWVGLDKNKEIEERRKKNREELGGEDETKKITPITSQAGSLISSQASLSTQSVPGNLKGMDGLQTAAYMKNVAKTESGGKITAENRYGYIGKYQFGAEALADQGLIDSDKLKAAKSMYGKAWYKGGQTAFLNDSSNWKIEGGKNAFLTNEDLQDRAMLEYTSKNIDAGYRSGALSEKSSAAQIAAYSKAAHLKGAGAANNLFLRGIDSRDANGTSAALYARQAADAVQYASLTVPTSRSEINPPSPTIIAKNTQSEKKVLSDYQTVSNNSVTQNYQQQNTSTGNPIIDELKTHTELLTRIATNTSYKPSSAPSSNYKKSPSEVANNVTA